MVGCDHSCNLRQMIHSSLRIEIGLMLNADDDNNNDEGEIKVVKKM